MLRDSVAQQNHVNVVAKRLFLTKPSALPFHPREREDTVSRHRLTSELSAFLECIAFALRALRCDFAWHWPRKVPNVTASFAFPRQRSFFFGTVKQFQRLVRVVTYSLEKLPERF